MSESFMRSILAKSLLIDFLLTSICLSHGDDMRHVAAARRVSNDDYSTGEQAQAGKPFLSIIEAIVHEGHARAAEHSFGIGKIQAVLDEVAAVLCLALFIVILSVVTQVTTDNANQRDFIAFLGDCPAALLEQRGRHK